MGGSARKVVVEGSARKIVVKDSARKKSGEAVQVMKTRFMCIMHVMHVIKMITCIILNTPFF